MKRFKIAALLLCVVVTTSALLLPGCKNTDKTQPDPQPEIEALPGLPPPAEDIELKTVRVQIGNIWYDYVYTGHDFDDPGDAAVAGICEDGSEALRAGASDAIVAVAGELYSFYSPAEDGTTLGDVFEIYGVPASGGSVTVIGERVDDEGALVEVEAKMEDGVFAELAQLEFASVERREQESVLMTDRTVTVSGGALPLELEFDPDSGLWWRGGLLLSTPEELRGEIVDVGEIDLTDDGRYTEYAEWYTGWSEEASEALNALTTEFMTYPEYADGGFYGGAYIEGGSLVVCLTENSEENRAKIEAVIHFDNIEYRECTYTLGELYDFRLWLYALQTDGRLPHVTEVLKIPDPRDGKVAVVLDEVSDESLDDLRRYDPDFSRTKVFWYEQSSLIAR